MSDIPNPVLRTEPPVLDRRQAPRHDKADQIPGLLRCILEELRGHMEYLERITQLLEEQTKIRADGNEQLKKWASIMQGGGL